MAGVQSEGGCVIFLGPICFRCINFELICQSFDITQHYCEEHNMVIEERDVALYRWYRYDMPVI